MDQNNNDVKFIDDAVFISDVLIELNKARTKFPGNKHMLAALAEEFGEVNRGFLEHQFGKALSYDVRGECVQLASMAIRVATEGDASFEYAPPQLEDGLLSINPLIIFREALVERTQQDEQWGGPTHDDQHDALDWCGYLEYQVSQCFLEQGTPGRNNEKFEERLIKIIALSLAAIQSSRRKKNAAEARNT